MAKKTLKLTQADVEAAAKAFAQANLELQSINAEKGKEFLVIEEKYKEQLDAETQKQKEAEEVIINYMKENPEVFGGKKSMKAWGVTIAHRSSDTWKFPEGKKWDDLKEDIKRVLGTYIRSSETVDVEALRADYAEPKVTKELGAIGVTLESDTKYSVKA
jgi:hypothetical protein